MTVKVNSREVLLLAVLLFLTAVLGSPARSRGEPAAIPASDSLAMAPNDSAMLAAKIAAITGKERASWSFRIRSSGLGQLYIKGGVFMHPLLACSIIGLVFVIERLWTLSRARINMRGLLGRVLGALREKGLRAAIEECEKSRGPVAAVLQAGLMRADHGPAAAEKAIETSGAIEMSFLERGLIALSTVSTIAPLLGFLGTVSGMIHAFAAIAAAEQVSAKLVASGIEEALITTLVGLVIAIPVSAAHNYFVSQISGFATEMEEASSELVNELVDRKIGV